jgi:SIR2-like domain
MATEQNQAPTAEGERAELLNDVSMKDISEGMIIPIISNSFRLEQIFRHKSSLTEKIAKTPRGRSTDEQLTAFQQLTKEWADFIQYPLPDDSNLARVAQYFQINKMSNDPPKAKEAYLKFLKAYLLDLDLNKLDDMAQRKLDQSFSDIVAELDYPIFPDGKDPLQLLANLPLPIYVTTSYFNFLERALKRAGKENVRTQVCSWGKAKARGSDLPDPNFEPSPEKPVVYHLFGLENYPPTLVLSEDDYMNWQISVTEELSQQNTSTTASGIPLILRNALADQASQLMILGYSLQDWEFRVLFRFIWRFREENLRRSTVIQLKPRPRDPQYEQNALSYLKEYFDVRRSNVKWTMAESYIHMLSAAYDNYRR